MIKAKKQFRKKLKYIFVIMSAVFALNSTAYADTIITAPIDSRPISTDYMKNLAQLGGDELIFSSKENLDFFSAVEADNYTGNSAEVRKELYELISASNTEDTTAVINMSSYLTNGLVGSRCGINYKNKKTALDELYKLITDNRNVKYYVNLPMPRTLPETRFNKIWNDDEKIKGIGFYYTKYQKNDDIKNKYAYVTPSQFLMEYSYVKNKADEKGRENIAQWEEDFLKDVEKNEKYFPYKNYLYLYKLPFESVSDIFGQLTRWKDEGLIDEIIISNDDFQLPDSISYIYSNTEDNSWIQTENSQPVKFSFARTYMTTGLRAVKRQLTLKYGEEETEKALCGLGESVNFIFGTDEVPQLIYARSLSKRKDISSDINIISDESDEIAKFDVIGVNELVRNDVNFVTASNKKGDKSDLYVYNYNTATDTTETIEKIAQSKLDGKDCGLIEIYSTSLLNTGDNKLFKEMSDTTVSSSAVIADLSSYSAWNTNANAIGLGVANLQTYSIGKYSEDTENFIKAHIKMLGQHIVEDGIYTINTKRQLSNERFIPSQTDRIKSEKLKEYLNCEKILDGLNGKYEINGKELEVKNCRLEEYNFPWGRTFDCFVDIECDVERVKKP